jgi:hypothetical protein
LLWQIAQKIDGVVAVELSEPELLAIGISLGDVKRLIKLFQSLKPYQIIEELEELPVPVPVSAASVAMVQTTTPQTPSMAQLIIMNQSPAMEASSPVLGKYIRPGTPYDQVNFQSICCIGWSVFVWENFKRKNWLELWSSKQRKLFGNNLLETILAKNGKKLEIFQYFKIFQKFKSKI